jgi:uncharacterized protein
VRLPFTSMFVTSPFEALQEHAEKVKECALAFQDAVECYVSKQCNRFEALRKEVIRLEEEADAIKRRIRGHLPIGTLMPVSKFQLFLYLREQDGVLDAVEDVLDWISFRAEKGLPAQVEKDFLLLVAAVTEPIEQMSLMVREAREYFRNYNEEIRTRLKEIIRNLRRQEHEADIIEQSIKRAVFSLGVDAVTVFHLVRLAEIIGSIADHAENAGDMMRAMIAK